jgi:hypothetical protein
VAGLVVVVYILALLFRSGLKTVMAMMAARKSIVIIAANTVIQSPVAS